jgi:hypothetical protein
MTGSETISGRTKSAWTSRSTRRFHKKVLTFPEFNLGPLISNSPAITRAGRSEMAIKFKGDNFLIHLAKKFGTPEGIVDLGAAATLIGVPVDVISNYSMGALPGPKVLIRICEVLQVAREELIEVCSSEEAGLIWTPTGKNTWDKRTPV